VLCFKGKTRAWVRVRVRVRFMLKVKEVLL
jgi:hypothetical protein